MLYKKRLRKANPSAEGAAVSERSEHGVFVCLCVCVCVCVWCRVCVCVCVCALLVSLFCFYVFEVVFMIVFIQINV